MSAESMAVNSFLLAVGSVWLLFGLAEIVIPFLIRLLFDLLSKRTILLPLTRMAMGILIIVGVLSGKDEHPVLILLGFVCQIAGAVLIFIPDEGRKAYLYWLRRRPTLTFRLLGAINALIGYWLLQEALF